MSVVVKHFVHYVLMPLLPRVCKLSFLFQRAYGAARDDTCYANANKEDWSEPCIFRHEGKILDKSAHTLTEASLISQPLSNLCAIAPIVDMTATCHHRLTYFEVSAGGVSAKLYCAKQFDLWWHNDQTGLTAVSNAAVASFFVLEKF